MTVKGWKYYNHAMVPTCAPHENPDLSAINDRDFWKPGGGRIPLFARWTEDFDCDNETEFWYTILDHHFDINSIKSKHRYYIKQGMKNFDVVKFDYYGFERYKKRLLGIINAVRINDYHIKAVSKIAVPTENQYYLGAFEKGMHDEAHLVGWAFVIEHEEYIEFSSLKVLPEYEKKSINAAIVYRLISEYNHQLSKSFYITNGTRTINHPTQFNKYLRRMFEFRKAYCKLRIKYRWFVKPVIRTLYPFRKKMYDKDKTGIMHQISAVLKMEEIARSR